MQVNHWYAVFQPPSWRWSRERAEREIAEYGWLRAYAGRFFGHVEVVGRTDDDTWIFYNPTFAGSIVEIEHRHDTVLRYLEFIYDGNLVLEVGPARLVPFHLGPAMNCATICGNILGFRAFTPAGLKRKLLRNGAKVIYDGTSEDEGRRGRQASA